MPNVVSTGATLQCSFGTTPATFAASGTQALTGGAAGVVTDVARRMCRRSACACRWPTRRWPRPPAQPRAHSSPQPCLPVLSPWTPGSAKVTVGEVPALDDSSQCNCTWGGVVTVSAAGQDGSRPPVTGRSVCGYPVVPGRLWRLIVGELVGRTGGGLPAGVVTATSTVPLRVRTG